MNTNNNAMPLDNMIEWFHTHYEDAIHSVFYDGREGGYQYAPGAGPCDPLDVLQGEFPDIDLGVIEKAVDILQSSGSAWVRRGHY
jgi:hypothetical protein